MSTTVQVGALAGADGPCAPGVFRSEPAAAFARLSRPVRPAASRSRSALVGVVPSTKMGEAFPFESARERDAMHLLDALEDVAAFRPQALRAAYAHEGRQSVAFPDLLVLLRTGGVEAWEVKAAAALTPMVRARLRAVADALARQGIRYRVRTEA